MGVANELDFGGMTILCTDIKVASAPGQPGTSAALPVSAGDITLATGKTINLDSANATLSSNAATLTKYAGTITTEALTTAHTASQAFALTLTGVAAGDLAFVTLAGGTNTGGIPVLKAVCTTNTCTVTVTNMAKATDALNGTLIFHLWILKA